MNFKNFSGARLLNCSFLFECSFDLLINFYFWIWLESCQWDWRPFCMHLPSSFLNIESDINLLVSVQFHNRNTHIFAVVAFRVKFNWQDRLFSILGVALINHINWFNVKGSNFSNILICIFTKLFVINLKPELKFTGLAIVNILCWTITLPRILIWIHLLAVERNKANPLGQEFIM